MLDSISTKNKKAKKDDLVEVVGVIRTSFNKFMASQKRKERPSDIGIHEVVFIIIRLTDTKRFKATQKLMNGDGEHFRLLISLPNEEKKKRGDFSY